MLHCFFQKICCVNITSYQVNLSNILILPKQKLLQQLCSQYVHQIYNVAFPLEDSIWPGAYIFTTPHVMVMGKKRAHVLWNRKSKKVIITPLA